MINNDYSSFGDKQNVYNLRLIYTWFFAFKYVKQFILD